VKRFNSLREVQHSLSSGSLVLPELLRHYLNRIELGKHLNAFIEVWPQDALTRAHEIQKKIDSNCAGRLAGMVLSVKDNIAVKSKRLSAGSKILESFASVYTATAIERLLEEDAILIGSVNCDEFAMGSSSENSAFGPVLNPHNEAHVPGGSSGGSAVSVAAQMCLASIGSDTGGSVRQPAALCGVVGFKPTYGSISRYGLTAYASSFDQIGPITNCVEDAEILYSIMAGPDEFDTTLFDKASVREKKEVKRIAFFKECLETQGLNSEVKSATLHFIEQCRAKGYTVEELSFDLLSAVVPTYYVLTTAEASSNLARYDGVHFGYQSPHARNIEQVYSLSRSEGFGWEVKRRIMMGTFVLSAEHYDRFFGQAQRVRTKIKQQIQTLFKEFDVLVMPCTADVAFKLGEKSDDPVAMYMEDIYTVLANLTGMPAISIPLGTRNGLPFGIQLLADEKSDATLLAFAQAMEKPSFF
jgi:aspartyl-tRNA(Asn)/glutamyl-tRNA(Gln) amidotransferase subunit A